MITYWFPVICLLHLFAPSSFNNTTATTFPTMRNNNKRMFARHITTTQGQAPNADDHDRHVNNYISLKKRRYLSVLQTSDPLSDQENHFANTASITPTTTTNQEGQPHRHQLLTSSTYAKHYHQLYLELPLHIRIYLFSFAPIQFLALDFQLRLEYYHRRTLIVLNRYTPESYFRWGIINPVNNTTLRPNSDNAPEVARAYKTLVVTNGNNTRPKLLTDLCYQSRIENVRTFILDKGQPELASIVRLMRNTKQLSTLVLSGPIDYIFQLLNRLPREKLRSLQTLALNLVGPRDSTAALFSSSNRFQLTPSDHPYLTRLIVNSASASGAGASRTIRDTTSTDSPKHSYQFHFGADMRTLKLQSLMLEGRCAIPKNLVDVVYPMVSLREFCLANVQISHQAHWERIISNLQYSKHLRMLDISNVILLQSPLSYLDIQRLLLTKEDTAAFPELQYLDISQTEITSSELVELIERFESIVSIRIDACNNLGPILSPANNTIDSDKGPARYLEIADASASISKDQSIIQLRKIGLKVRWTYPDPSSIFWRQLGFGFLRGRHARQFPEHPFYYCHVKDSSYVLMPRAEN